MLTPINYIEMPSTDLMQTKAFYRDVFGWEFEDYGDAYCAVLNAGIDGGFFLTNKVMQTENGSALVVLHNKDLPAVQAKIIAAGGKVVVDTFAFPGGRRFHFTDPCGNELAVWAPDDNEAS